MRQNSPGRRTAVQPREAASGRGRGRPATGIAAAKIARPKPRKAGPKPPRTARPPIAGPTVLPIRSAMEQRLLPASSSPSGVTLPRNDNMPGHHEHVQGADPGDHGLQHREIPAPGQRGGQRGFRDQSEAGDPRCAKSPQQRAGDRGEHDLRQNPPTQRQHERASGAVAFGHQDRQRRHHAPATQIGAEQREPQGTETGHRKKGFPVTHGGEPPGPRGIRSRTDSARRSNPGPISRAGRAMTLPAAATIGGWRIYTWS